MSREEEARTVVARAAEWLVAMRESGASQDEINRAAADVVVAFDRIMGLDAWRARIMYGVKL